MKKQRQSRGFTLIELMVVVAILLVVLTMSYPAIRDAMHREPLTQAVHDVVEGCQKARRRAISQGSPADLVFFQDGRIELQDAPKDEDPSAQTPDGRPTHPVIETQSDAPRRPKESFSAQLSDSVAIEMIDVNFQDYRETDGARVRFYQNGTSDELTLVLFGSGSSERRKITLEVVTALVEVEPL